jgi:hypothetical protein
MASFGGTFDPYPIYDETSHNNKYILFDRNFNFYFAVADLII